MARLLQNWVLLLLCLALGGAACKKIFNPTAGRVTAIDANLDSLYKVEGGLQDARYAAYFQQSEVQLIEEKPQPENREGPDRRYYFRSNDLFFYRETAPGGEVHFYRDENGVSKAERVTGGRTAALDPEAVAPVLRRAEELKVAAVARAGKALSLPLLRNR